MEKNRKSFIKGPKRELHFIRMKVQKYYSDVHNIQYEHLNDIGVLVL